MNWTEPAQFSHGLQFNFICKSLVYMIWDFIFPSKLKNYENLGKLGQVWASLGKFGQVRASLGEFGQVRTRQQIRKTEKKRQKE